MYTRHQEAALRLPDRSTLWRYMAFWKFDSMVRSSSTWFCRSDKFSDSWEGHPSTSSDTYRRLHGLFDPGTLEETNIAMHRAREFMAVSCWHANDYENDALWSAYGHGSDSLAIRSTVGGLKSSFSCAAEPIYIGEVQYIDYGKAEFPASDVLTPLFRKRMEYQAEREVRAVYRATEGVERFGLDASPLDGGIGIKTVIPELIEAVVLSPKRSSGFRDHVESLCRSVGLSVPIVESTLRDAAPNWPK